MIVHTVAEEVPGAYHHVTDVSGATYDQVRKVLPITFVNLGAQSVKNIEEPVRAYQVSTRSLASQSTAAALQ
jgi:adenylate cyclase